MSEGDERKDRHNAPVEDPFKNYRVNSEIISDSSEDDRDMRGAKSLRSSEEKSSELKNCTNSTFGLSDSGNPKSAFSGGFNWSRSSLFSNSFGANEQLGMKRVSFERAVEPTGSGAISKLPAIKIQPVEKVGKSRSFESDGMLRHEIGQSRGCRAGVEYERDWELKPNNRRLDDNVGRKISKGQQVSQPSNEQDDLKAEVTALRRLVSSLEAKFASSTSNENLWNTSQPSGSWSIGQGPRWESTPQLDRGRDVGNQRDPTYEAFSRRGARQVEEIPRGLRSPVWKWKIQKFDGHESNLSRFLTLVGHYAVAEGATDEDLFRNRIHLFTGDAADFVATHANVQTWAELVEELCQYVLGSNSDYDRIRIIERKKQGAESCAIFITRMDMLFRNMRQIPDEQQRIHIIMRGFKSHIRQALAGNTSLRTLSDLRSAAQQVENVCTGLREVHAVDQTPTEKPRGPPYRSSGRRAARTRDKDREESNPREFVVCFRCGQRGHYRNECTNSPKLCCHGCGREGVFQSECPECQGNQ